MRQALRRPTEIATGDLSTDGALILEGTMKNAPAKKLGLELAAATSGMRAIVDRLKVARASRTSSFAASNSIFNIAGSVDDYAQKVAAEKAVKRLFGVKGLANELLVRMVSERTDTDIAKDAIYLLECDVHFLGSKVTVIVEDGLLTLEGTMEWDFQKVAAEKVAQCIRGVKAL